MYKHSKGVKSGIIVKYTVQLKTLWYYYLFCCYYYTPRIHKRRRQFNWL